MMRDPARPESAHARRISTMWRQEGLRYALRNVSVEPPFRRQEVLERHDATLVLWSTAGPQAE